MSYKKIEPYLSLAFKRPNKDGQLSSVNIYFDGMKPLPGTFWKIERKSTTHINGIEQDKNKRMRLRFYSSPIEGGNYVPDEWTLATGVRINMYRRVRNPQYLYRIEPLG